MNPATPRETEALRCYSLYWGSYLQGDIDSFSSTLDEDFEMIGTSEREVCHSKPEGIAFYQAQMAEVVGKVEMRNRKITTKSFDGMVLVNEACEIYIRTERNWNFYSKIRLSTLLHETGSGWKIIQQHGSLPDMRVEEGETIAFEKISEENLKLRDAIQRATVELEQKNRELQIEAALERVRAKTMAMHMSDELLDVVKILGEQFEWLGFKFDSVNFSTDYKEKDFRLWLYNSGTAMYPGQIHIPYIDHPCFNRVHEALNSGEDFQSLIFTKEEKDSFFDHAFATSLAKHISEERKKYTYAAPGMAMSIAVSKNTSVTVVNYHVLPFSEEENDILRRFSNVFEQAYTRFLDLQKAEAQAREAQIEAALERVRARTMGMQKSEDLKEVAKVLYGQLKELGFRDGTAGIIIINSDSGDIDCWGEGFEDGYDFPEKYHVPNFIHRGHLEMTNNWKNGISYAEIDIHGQEKKKLDEHYFFHSDFARVPESTKQFMMQQESIRWSMAYMQYGALNWVPTSISDDQAKIMQRLAKVFEQSYTRFIDLQKAEAQAREAQIEAALEKVRSRALAMHHSSELAQVVGSLFDRLVELGLAFDGAGIFEFHRENRGITLWIATTHLADPTRINLPFDEEIEDNVLWRDLWQAFESGTDILSRNYSGEAKNKYFRYVAKYNEYPLSVKQLQQEKDWTAYSVASKYGLVGFDSWSGHVVKEEVFPVLRRFAAVFDQAYTRFIDLQKAEAQAREALIEASLERVRSKSMAMHNSEELPQVIKTVFEEFQHLGLRLDLANFNYLSKNKDWHMWLATPVGAFPEMIHVPYLDHPLFSRPIEAAAKGLDFWGDVLSFEEKNSAFQHFLAHTPLGHESEERKQYYSECPGLARSIVFMKSIALTISNGAAIPYTEEENEILRRIAYVFEQSYTRFLDLQKAEAQAREAQIEAALERVRSRTMAMQSSDELADAAYVLFEQLNILGVTHERINIGIVNEANQTIDFWVTEQGGNKLNTKFSGRISEPTTLSKAYEAWKKGEKSLTVDLKGEALQSWLRYLNEEIKIPFNKAFLHDRRVQTVGFFSKGMLVVTSPEPLQEEALYLLEKFAGVFDLTYTRFSDLKLAEAHALQAERDLEEIKIARKKAEDALNELKSTQAQLIQQEKLASLGQLTAGIAHEIKNPLNFVNNFSEVSIEMIGEIKEERAKKQEERDESLVDEILGDVQSNLEKIHEHGSRANSIVSSMLQHSRGGTGKKEPTLLNALIKEYVNLSFHGMRAGKNPIHVDIQLELDSGITEVPLIKEDFSRVIINLCNNAFDAMREKVTLYEIRGKRHLEGQYSPRLRVATKAEKDQVIISFEDNGTGISEEIRDKILQPFFTTKKGTEGTGLGLSITHDIIQAHGGKIKIDTEVGKGTIFMVLLESTTHNPKANT